MKSKCSPISKCKAAKSDNQFVGDNCALIMNPLEQLHMSSQKLHRNRTAFSEEQLSALENGECD